MITQRHNPAYRCACIFAIEKESEIKMRKKTEKWISSSFLLPCICQKVPWTVLVNVRDIFLRSICSDRLLSQDQSERIHDPAPVRWR